MNHTKISRRNLLKTAGAALAAPYIIPGAALGLDGKASASERVVLGHIGVGGQGSYLFANFQNCQNAQSVAVADAYKDRARPGSQCKGKAYLDYRELLARADIDAVIIATPDHAHVPIAIAAARAGKDAYVEKPLGLSIEQCLACRRVFDEKKRLFQYGTMQRSNDTCRQACEIVRHGKIGKIKALEVIAPNGGAARLAEGDRRSKEPRFRRVARTRATEALHGRSLQSARLVLDLRLLNRLSGRLGGPSTGPADLGL